MHYFARLTDPRIERNREHVLEEILLIAIAAVLSGAESWNDIADCGESNREWLKTFLTLPGGVPSHDTFNRVFAALDPEEFEQGFAAWIASIAKLTAGEVVAIDGKTLCGTRQAPRRFFLSKQEFYSSDNRRFRATSCRIVSCDCPASETASALLVFQWKENGEVSAGYGSGQDCSS